MAGFTLHLRHELRMHVDQIIEELLLSVKEKRGRQGVALLGSKPPELWDVVGLHSRTEPLEKFWTDACMLEWCEVERADLAIPLQRGQDVPGFRFGWVHGKAVEVGRVLWVGRECRGTQCTYRGSGLVDTQESVNGLFGVVRHLLGEVFKDAVFGVSVRRMHRPFKDRTARKDDAVSAALFTRLFH